MEKIKSECQVCHRTFTLSHQQAILVTDLLKRNLNFIMVECPLCGFATNYKAENETIQNINITVSPSSYRCPVSHCSGWVDFINEETSEFFGCGECGSIWHEEKNFQKEITDIISLYDYRAKCYEIILDKWMPSAIKNEDKNYEKLIECEPFDKSKSFIRG